MKNNKNDWEKRWSKLEAYIKQNEVRWEGNLRAMKQLAEISVQNQKDIKQIYTEIEKLRKENQPFGSTV